MVLQCIIAIDITVSYASFFKGRLLYPPSWEEITEISAASEPLPEISCVPRKSIEGPTIFNGRVNDWPTVPQTYSSELLITDYYQTRTQDKIADFQQ